MDEKTLAHMVKRVDEARAIKGRIKEIESQLEEIKRNAPISLCIYGLYGAKATIQGADDILTSSAGFREAIECMLLQAIQTLHERLEAL